MGRFLGNVLEAPCKRPARVKAAACELRTEEGDVLLAGTYERCASEVVKRCRALFKGTTGGFIHEPGKGNRFAWTIVGPDGAVRTRHALTVLS